MGKKKYSLEELNNMTVKELNAACKAQNIPHYKGGVQMKKADLVAALAGKFGLSVGNKAEAIETTPVAEAAQQEAQNNATDKKKHEKVIAGSFSYSIAGKVKHAVKGHHGLEQKQHVRKNYTGQQKLQGRWQLRNTKEYIEKAPVGTIIAFADDYNVVRSGKLMHRSSKRELVEAETEYGKSFIVPYSRILWIRSGWKWPRLVYEMLKGRVRYEP